MDAGTVTVNPAVGPAPPPLIVTGPEQPPEATAAWSVVTDTLIWAKVPSGTEREPGLTEVIWAPAFCAIRRAITMNPTAAIAVMIEREARVEPLITICPPLDRADPGGRHTPCGPSCVAPQSMSPATGSHEDPTGTGMY